MDEYLTTTLANLKSSKYKNLSIVLGNESCDLDSAISAIVYAAFLNWQHAKMKCRVCTRLKRDDATYIDDIFVSILNVNREDYQLKTEVTFCLMEHGIDASQLVFRDDFPLESLSDGANVILVDHHVLAARDSFLAPRVVEIIDHRPMDRESWIYGKDTRSSIELVGSCCSMVTQRIRDLSKLFATAESFFTANNTAADLLHCGIILDTVNFSEQVNKATPLDKEMVEFLETVLKPDSYEEERNRKLDRLVRARIDVSSLSACQLLRKDVKLANDVFVPSLPILVEEFFLKEGAIEAACAETSRRGCDAGLILGMSLEGSLKRDLAVVHNSSTHAKQLADYLQEWKAPDFQLVPRVLPNIAYASDDTSSTTAGQTSDLAKSAQNLSNASKTLTNAPQTLSNTSKTLTNVQQNLSNTSKIVTNAPQTLSNTSKTLNNAPQTLSNTSKTLTNAPQNLSNTSKTLTNASQILANAPTIIYFTQLNLSASRKQYMPALAKYQQKQR